MPNVLLENCGVVLRPFHPIGSGRAHEGSFVSKVKELYMQSRGLATQLKKHKCKHEGSEVSAQVAPACGPTSMSVRYRRLFSKHGGTTLEVDVRGRATMSTFATVKKRSASSVIRRKVANASADQPEAFVKRAARLDRLRRTDSALDLIYDSVDELMRKEEFSQLDAALSTLKPAELSVDILLGILTATLPARSRLPARNDLFRSAEEALKNRGEYEERLLTGLEG